MGIGVWVLVSPWVLGISGVRVVVWSNLAAGLALILVNLWIIFSEEPGYVPGADGSLEQRMKEEYNGKVAVSEHVKKKEKKRTVNTI